MSRLEAATDPVRAFVVAWHLRNEPRYKIAGIEDELQEKYGSYAAYDGLDILGSGSTRNLRTSLDYYRDRLTRAAMPIFLWRPDEDRKVREWLDGDHSTSDDEWKCEACDGSGRCPECDGSGRSSGLGLAEGK